MNLSFPGVLFCFKTVQLDCVTRVFGKKNTKNGRFCLTCFPKPRVNLNVPKLIGGSRRTSELNSDSWGGGLFVCTGHWVQWVSQRDFFCSYKWSYGAPVNIYIYIHNTLVHIKISVWQHADMLGFVFFCVLGSKMGLDSFGVISTIWCNLY